MSTTASTTDYEVLDWVHHRTRVQAVRYDGTEHGRRWLADWVTSNGGQVWDRFDGSLYIDTDRGPLPVQPDEFVVRGIEVEGRRKWFPLSATFAALAYGDANGDEFGATLDRDQAAAIVVAADESVDAAQMLGADDLYELREIVAKLAESVHLLGASGEGLR